MSSLERPGEKVSSRGTSSGEVVETGREPKNERRERLRRGTAPGAREELGAARGLAGAALLGAGLPGDFSASCDGAPSGAVVLSGAVRSCTAHLLPEVVILRVHGPWSFS